MLVRENPRLSGLWDESKNGSIPEDLTIGSPRKVWWLCEHRHSFTDSVVKRATAKHTCPVCANKKVIPGVNDVLTLHPELEQYWSAKNEISLSELNPKSAKKYVWVGECGHEWLTEMRKMVTGKRQCPYCSGQEVLPGFNDLLTVNPQLAAEYDETRNTVPVNEVHNGTRKNVWWKCKNGHSWFASVHSRKRRESGCPLCKGRVAIPGETDFSTTHKPWVDQLHPSRNEGVVYEELKASSHVQLWWVCEKGHEWKTFLYNRQAGKGCPHCSPTISKAETRVADFLRSIVTVKVEMKDRTVIFPYELDIYIPEKQVAVEFNGLYWHTEEQGKHRTYHYDKWLKCKNQGVRLVQVWEDDWNRNPGLVKRMLAHMLGVTREREVPAEGTRVVAVSETESEQFLENNHIQGFSSGSHYLGLRDTEKEELVAVMVLQKTDSKTLNIIRYATSVNVVEGFTKLLKHVERNYAPDEIITFSDHCLSDSRLYETNEFTPDGDIPPDYMYVVKGERKHKSDYSLKRFRDDPNLIWEEGLTERELATLNKIPRVWDAGKTRWVKNRYCQEY